MEVTSGRRVYPYKAGLKVGLLGAAFVLGCLATSKELLGSETEWHVFSADDPFVVPSILIKLLWWVGFALGATAIFVSRAAPTQVELDDRELSVPNPLTRKYTSVPLADVVHVTTNRHAITVSTRDRAVSVGKLFMVPGDFDELTRLLAERTGSGAILPDEAVR